MEEKPGDVQGKDPFSKRKRERNFKKAKQEKRELKNLEQRKGKKESRLETEKKGLS